MSYGFRSTFPSSARAMCPSNVPYVACMDSSVVTWLPTVGMLIGRAGSWPSGCQAVPAMEATGPTGVWGWIPRQLAAATGVPGVSASPLVSAV